jgi:hypothetical protein
LTFPIFTSTNLNNKKTQLEKGGEEMNGGNQQSNVSVFLLGVALNLIAAIDYTSLLDYGLKAILGGVIWLGFKILGEYIARKIQSKTVKFHALRRKAGLRVARDKTEGEKK